MNCSITSPLEDANGEALAWHAEALPARELGDAAAVWDAMLDKLWGEHPLLKSMFINNLLRTFGTGREYLCVGTDTTGSPRAMAIVERVGLGRWQSFLPSEALIGPTLAYNVEQMDGLLASLPRPAVQVDLLSVDSQLADLTDNTPAPNSTWHALRAAIEVQGSFDSYWSERPSELRENVERNRCILGAEPASLKFVAIQSSEETTRALELHAALASDGPNPAAGAAAIADSRYAAFQRNLMNDAAHAGAARVFQLWRHDVLIASQLGLVNGRWLALLEPAYRQNVAESAPEQILLRHIVEHVFRQHRGGIIEFYGNPYNETKAWGTCTRAIRHINLYRFPHWREIVSAKRALTSRIAMPFVRPLKAKSHLSVQAYTSIDALPTDALTLFEEAEHRYGVQAGADWFRNLCGTVPPLGENAFFVVLRRSANAVAILPLLLSPTADGGSKRLSALSNFYTSLYAPPIQSDVTSEELAYLLGAARHLAAMPARLHLGPMNPHGPEFTLLRSAMSLCGFIVIPNLCFGNWLLPRPESFESYITARPGAVRSTLRRMGKRFTAAGGQIEILSGEDDVARGLLAYEKVYAASWKQPEPFPQFIPGLMSLAAQRGWLRLGIAWVEQRPIAVQLWLVGCRRAEIFKLAYDEQYKSLSAGTLLTAALIEAALDDREVEFIDYLTGDDSYKRDWMTRRTERWGLTAYDPMSFYGVASLLGRAAKRVKARMSEG